MYECDLDMVWNLPYCVGSFYDENVKGYCAIGKVAKACDIDAKDVDLRFSDFGIKLNEILKNYIDISDGDHLSGWGWLKHDRVVCESENKKQTHELICRNLLEICLKHGLIKLKDSDLAVVKELKKEFVNA